MKSYVFDCFGSNCLLIGYNVQPELLALPLDNVPVYGHTDGYVRQGPDDTFPLYGGRWPALGSSGIYENGPSYTGDDAASVYSVN